MSQSHLPTLLQARTGSHVDARAFLVTRRLECSAGVAAVVIIGRVMGTANGAERQDAVVEGVEGDAAG